MYNRASIYNGGGVYNQAPIYKGVGVYNLGDDASTELPANTLRFMFSKSDYDPTEAGVGSSGTWTKKTEFPNANVWDWTNSNVNWATAFGGGGTDIPGAFNDANNIVRVIAAGDTSSVTNFSRLFQNCRAIKSVCQLDTSGANNLFLMFSHCEIAERLPNLDFTNATDVRAIFQFCLMLRRAPELTMPSSPLSFQNIFYHCESLEEITIDFDNKVTILGAAFYNCYKLKKASIKNTTGCTNLQNLFYHCYELEEVSLFDTSSVTIFSQMFIHCHKLKNIPYYDTSSGTKFNQTFRECYSIKSIPLFNTSNGTDFSHFAHRCYNLEEFPPIDTSKATRVNRIASCCPKLTSFPLIDTSNAVEMNEMLTGLDGNLEEDIPMHIKEIPAFDYSSAEDLTAAFGYMVDVETIPAIDAPKATNVSHIFKSCVNAKNGIKEQYDRFVSMATPPATHNDAFKNCGSDTPEGQIALSQIPASWGGLAEG